MTERTAQMAKGPAAPLLDDASGPLGAGLSVKQWAARCDAAVSEVAESWRTVKTSRNGAKVVMGRFPGSPVTSVGWVQDFPEIDLNRGITQQVLRELFHSKQMGAHATSWDTTFRGCTVLADVPGQTEKSTSAIHWRFSAPPLARRELVYLIAEQDFESEFGVKRTLYGYISVSDQWLNDVTGCVVEQSNHVRSANMFPTCDRLTVLDGGRLLRVEHLMTTKLSGLIPSWAYNTLFSAALKKANAHEADLVKAYVEQTANARLEDQIASGTI